jgi:hypothetical protein
LQAGKCQRRNGTVIRKDGDNRTKQLNDVGLVVYGEAVGDLNRRSSGEQEKGRREEHKAQKSVMSQLLKVRPHNMSENT